MFDEWSLGGMGTIMGELNRPWAEHLVPIGTLYLEVYAILGADGKPLPPAACFSFFSRHGIAEANADDKPLVDGDQPFRQVWYSEAPVDELQSQVTRSRADRGNEGVVIYACSEDDSVLGLVKIKTNEYVIKRRLRETIRGRLMSPLSHGEILSVVPIGNKRKGNCIRSQDPKIKEGDRVPLAEVIEKVQLQLRGGMRNLAHVPGCAEMHTVWADWACGFVDWWIENRLKAAYENEEDDIHRVAANAAALRKMLEEYDCTFASLVATYEEACGILETEVRQNVMLGNCQGSTDALRK